MFKLDAARFQPHLDSAQSVFFARELEEIDARMYDVKYAKLEAFELLPVKSDINPGAETYTFRGSDFRGKAVVTSNYASGSPRADVNTFEDTTKVRSVRDSYGYNIQEIRAAAMENRPLDTMRAESARRAINEKINEIGLTGDAAHNLIGLYNQPNTVVTVAGTKTGGGTAWTIAATVDEILQDLYNLVDGVPQATQRIHNVDRILLPYAKLDFINSRRMGAGDGAMTILRAFQSNRPGVAVRGALGLEVAGTASGTRGIGYKADPEILQFLVPIAFESFPPQQVGMEFVVENHARVGSVVVRYPKALNYINTI